MPNEIDRPLPAAVAVEFDRVRQRVLDAVNPNTKRTYRSSLAVWTDWCHSRGVSPLTPDARVVAAFLNEQGDRFSMSTVQVRHAAIKKAYELAKLPPPTEAIEVRELMRALRRTKGTAPEKQKLPVMYSDLVRMVAALDTDDLIDLRDRALLLVGWTSAMRRSELVGLMLSDVRFDEEGLRLQLRRSKADQEGRGHVRGLPYATDTTVCPVIALHAWIEAVPIREGAVFRSVDRHGNVGNSLSKKAVKNIVRRTALDVGVKNAAKLGAHSLRSGFITTAVRHGVSEADIMAHTGHRSTRVMRSYVREGNLWRRNPLAKLPGFG